MKVQFPQVKFAKLEFVVRTQQNVVNSHASGKADQERRDKDGIAETAHFVADNSDLLPLVITSGEGEENNTYYLTPVDKFQEGLSYQLTEGGLLVSRTGVPLTVTNIGSI